MKGKKRINKSQNIHLALFFCGFLLALIIFSLLFKSVQVFQRSGFDGKHRFTIAASFSNVNELISFSPDNGTISILLMPREDKISEIQKKVQVPVDGNVVLSSIDNVDSNDVPSRISLFVFKKESDNRLTIIDYLRLYLFSKTVPQSQITIKKMEPEEDFLINDKIVSGLFSDHTISKEQINIQVINGSGKEGVGNRLARLIANSGGNVISVVTGKPSDDSKILFSEESYTLSRLSRILGFKKEKNLEEKDHQIYDIIITIGKDSLLSEKF